MGDTYFRLEPDEAEWKEARRLAKKCQAGAVVIGHTHAARWKAEDGLVFANTGTWIHLMQLPSFDAGSDVWAEFLAELRRNPQLAPERQRHARTLERFTLLLAEPQASGATLSLVEWNGRHLTTLGEAGVPKAG